MRRDLPPGQFVRVSALMKGAEDVFGPPPWDADTKRKVGRWLFEQSEKSNAPRFDPRQAQTGETE